MTKNISAYKGHRFPEAVSDTTYGGPSTKMGMNLISWSKTDATNTRHSVSFANSSGKLGFGLTKS